MQLASSLQCSSVASNLCGNPMHPSQRPEKDPSRSREAQTAQGRPLPTDNDRLPHYNSGAETDPQEAQQQYGDVAATVFEWFQSHISLIKQSSLLLAADTRLAATSTLQLGILGLLAGCVLICTWITLMAALVVTTLWLGHSIGIAITGILILHIGLLIGLSFAIRSTVNGIRFKASRKFFSANSTSEKRYD